VKRGISDEFYGYRTGKGSRGLGISLRGRKGWKEEEGMLSYMV